MTRKTNMVCSHWGRGTSIYLRGRNRRDSIVGVRRVGRIGSSEEGERRQG